MQKQNYVCTAEEFNEVFRDGKTGRRGDMDRFLLIRLSPDRHELTYTLSAGSSNFQADDSWT